MTEKKLKGGGMTDTGAMTERGLRMNRINMC